MLLCITVEQFAAYFPGAAYKFYHKLNSLSSCITYKQTNSEKLLTPSHPLGTWGRDERVGMSEISLVTTLPKKKMKFTSKVIFCFATQLLSAIKFSASLPPLVQSIDSPLQYYPGSRFRGNGPQQAEKEAYVTFSHLRITGDNIKLCAVKTM